MKKIIRILIAALCLSICFSLCVACEKEIEKTQLDTPVITSAVYTGKKLTATVPANDGYTVVKNEGGIDVGEYDVVIKLADSAKFAWKDFEANEAGEITLKFAITQADNAIDSLTLSNWAYGETANTPVATAKFGTPVFTYSDAENGTFTETVPSSVGSYFVKATVAETKNYKGATKVAAFSIEKVRAAIDTAPTAIAGISYVKGTLNNLVVAGTSADGNVEYKLGESGEWQTAIPTAENAGEYKVYYRVVGDSDHSNLEVEAPVIVTIAKADAALTAPTAKAELVYNGEAQALVEAGSVTAGAIKYSLDGETYASEVPQGTNAGDYTVYYKVELDENYNAIEGGNVAVSIAKATATLTAPTAKAELVYNGEAQALVEAGSVTAGAIKYSLDGETYASEVPQGTNAGDYTVYYKVELDENYNAIEGGNVPVSIAKAKNEFTITNESLDVKYGKAPNPVASDSVIGDVTFTYVAGTINENGEFTASGEPSAWSTPSATSAYKCIATASGDANHKQGTAEKVFNYTAETLPEYTAVNDDNKAETINALVDYLAYIDSEYTDEEKSAYTEPKKVSYLRKYLEGELYEVAVTKKNTDSSAYNWKDSQEPEDWLYYSLNADKTAMDASDSTQRFTKNCTVFEINMTGDAHITMPAIDYNLFSSVRFCVKSDFAADFTYSAYDTEISKEKHYLFFYVENGVLSVYIQNGTKLVDIMLPADVLCGKSGLKIDVAMNGYGSFKITEMRCILKAGSADIKDYVAKSYADALIAAENVTTENESQAYTAFVNYLGYVANNNITESFGIFVMPTEKVNALKTKFAGERFIYDVSSGEISCSDKSFGAVTEKADSWYQNDNSFQLKQFVQTTLDGEGSNHTITLPKINYNLYNNVQFAFYIAAVGNSFKLTVNGTSVDLSDEAYYTAVVSNGQLVIHAMNAPSNIKLTATLSESVLSGEEALTIIVDEEGWNAVHFSNFTGILK